MSLSAFMVVRKAKLGLSILQLNMWANRAKDHDVIFNSAWALSKRLGGLLSAFSSVGNPWGYEAHQVVYLRLLRLLHRIKPGYRPAATVINEHILADIARSKVPTIIVTVHSPAEAVLSRVLQEREIESAVVAGNHTTVAEKSRLLGCDRQLELIADTDDALLQMRRHLRRNRTVHLCVDYRISASGTTALYISSAAFTLAGSTAVNIVFSDTNITRDGHIDVKLHAPDLSQTRDPDDIARLFLRWLKTACGHTRHWTLTPARHRGKTS